VLCWYVDLVFAGRRGRSLCSFTLPPAEWTYQPNSAKIAISPHDRPAIRDAALSARVVARAEGPFEPLAMEVCTMWQWWQQRGQTLVLAALVVGRLALSGWAQPPAEPAVTPATTVPIPGSLFSVGDDVRQALRHIADGDLPAGLDTLTIRAGHSLLWTSSGDSGETLAAAALHRALSQLDSAERYDLLYRWTFPENNPATIRHWISPASTVQPPDEFARLLGERPRASSFPVAAIHGVPGIFSTGWMLVTAAQDAGQLRRLTTELEAHVARDTPGADVLWLLAKSVDDQIGDADLLAAWRVQRRPTPAPVPAVPMVLPGSTPPAKNAAHAAIIPAAEVLIALATLPRPALADERVRVLREFAELTVSDPAPILHPFLVRAYAHALLAKSGIADAAFALQPQLPHWHSVTTAMDPRRVTGPSVWLAQEQGLLHLTGSGHDLLQCRYPVTGDFQFQSEFQSGGPLSADGGLTYDGWTTEATIQTVEFLGWDSQGQIRKRGNSLYLDAQFGNVYGRTEVVHTDQATTFLINQHPLWQVPSAAASPWLGVRAAGDRRAVFRHLQVTGQPTIPRVVSMLSGTELTGWFARRLGEPWPTAFSARPQPTTATPFDWTLAEGVLQAEPLADAETDAPRFRWLSYQRPLLDGETWQYEFQHQPGRRDVHPAVGRVVFLLQPDGVRLRWMTEGEEEWTGLPSENTLVEPLNRRGPAALPLMVDDWNRVTLTRQAGVLTLSLNDQEIYQRPIDWSGDQRMGFYRDARSNGARIRRSVLWGNWPETWPAELNQHPVATYSTPLEPTLQQAISTLFQEDCFANDVLAVRQRVAQLPVDERLAALTKWVLPSETHATYRMWGAFTTTDPPGTPFPTDATPDRGGHLVSPVFDWLDLAREQQQIAPLRDILGKLPEPVEEYQQRCHWALQTLLALESGDEEAATAACLKLHALAKVYTAVGLDDQWPETLCLFYGIPRYRQFGPLGDLLNSVYSQRTLQWRPAGHNNWHHHLTRLAEHHLLVTAPAGTVNLSPTIAVSDWIPGGMMKSATRGRGHPPAVWEFRPGEVSKVSGHDEDYVFYRLPLLGDFEVDAELSNPSRDPTQILIGGQYVGPRWTAEEIEVGTLVRSPKFLKIAPKFQAYGPWVHYRGVVRDSKLSVYFNGRLAHTTQLPADRQPWIGFRAWGKQHGAIRNLRIIGQPDVPESVPLVVNQDLLGWYSYHHDELVGTQKGATWGYVDDAESPGMLLGKRRLDVADSWYESLLCYARPLIAGEQIDLEFYYVPGEVLAHPALDRWAFLLEPQGVREHWLTDGRYNTTGVGPQNVVDRPEYRRGPGNLPLKRDDWNQLRLKLVDQQLQLVLNEQLIYERPIDPLRVQTFGLFRYADQSEVRVRNVQLSGDWPRTLPQQAQQSLVQTSVLELDRQRDALPATFEHNFALRGVPSQYFKLPTPRPTISHHQRLMGLFVSVESDGAWNFNEIKPRFSLQGDFDLELTFDQLETPSEKDSGLVMTIQLDDEQQTQYRIHRIKNSAQRHEVHLSTSYLLPNQQRVYPSLGHAVCEASSGRVRLARRGDKIYFLYAAADAPLYRLVWTETASAVPAGLDSIGLLAVVNGVGKALCVWKTVRISAEKLFWNPESTTARPRGLFVMRPDGSDRRLIASPAHSGYQVVGSAEWSTDGRQIAVDMSNGSTSTSHILVMQADGSNVKDLGPGCMPSFSADAQRIIFSDVSGGVMMMHADGSNRTTIDNSGWGTQWSPDGKWIAYGKSGNVVLMDARTQTTRELLTGEHATRYSSIYWNLGWSHDSRTIGFKARRRDGSPDEVAVVDIDQAGSLQVLLSKAQGINPDITFTAASDGVVYAAQNPRTKQLQLFAVLRSSPDQPRLLEHQPDNLVVYDAHWSRDGKWLAFSGQELAGPIEWTPDMVARQYDRVDE